MIQTYVPPLKDTAGSNFNFVLSYHHFFATDMKKEESAILVLKGMYLVTQSERRSCNI